VRLALAQINTIVGDIDGNVQKIIEQISRARVCGADMVAFPELAITGYPPEDLLLKDHFVTRNLKALKAVARASKGMIVILGVVDRDRKGLLYNAAAVIAGGKIGAIYHKEHLPNYSVFDEKRYFACGKEASAKVFKAGDLIFGVNVCEDIWADAGPWKKQVNAGASLIINISSSPYEIGKREERLKLLRRRAKATGAMFAYVNLVGGQDELVFDGASLVVNAAGKLVAWGKQFAEDMVIYDVHSLKPRKAPRAVPLVCKTAVSLKPVNIFNAPCVLSRVEEIYEAVVLGTRDYIVKNGFKKVLIGLSGGIDSALVAAIAVEAVGKENVVAISMPTRFNAEATKSDARALAKNMGIAFHEIPIEGVFESFLSLVGPFFKDTSPGLAEENLQARIRGNLLMAFSNKFGWLLLTTGNKSEMATGYCTLYGDMSGGYAVIKDILKTTVYELSEYVNIKAGHEVIPRTIITRPPSAELRFDQKDQDSLPPYSVLDELLGLYVEDHRGLEDMKKACGDMKMVEKVVSLVDKSEYKRRQAPPGVKISKRAFGKDWRLPLTNRYKAI
jgi:NAD+ synthase (glutamine-hydrolysing)